MANRSCARCRREPEPGRMFCSFCAQAILDRARALPPRAPRRRENATAFTSNGLTYASINGREVLPDIIVTHESVAPAIAAQLLARLRQVAGPTNDTDLEWDPD